MVNNVESVTWANLNSDHFPVEATICLKLGKGRRGDETVRLQRYEFAYMPKETRERLHEDAKGWLNMVREAADDVDGAWVVLRTEAHRAMGEHVPKAPNKGQESLDHGGND